MYGTSYSGFNSLHMAAEHPPALKAVIAIYATDDRFTDDVHSVVVRDVGWTSSTTATT